MNWKKITRIAAALLMPLPLLAGTDNIAPEAKVTASTEKSADFCAKHVADGKIGIDGIGEWACEGVTTDWGYIRFPWVQLEWERERIVEKVVLFDRPSMKEHIAGGKLLFSDGSIVWVRQLPNDGSGQSISFPARKAKWVKFVVTDGTGSDLGLSELEVYPSPEDGKDKVSWVDPYIETNRGRYFFFVTGSLPFGMVSAAPHTRNKNQNGGGYNYNEKEILGFGQIHCWMLSGIELMPAGMNEEPSKGEQGWKSSFNHDDEIVQPGYHRVFLQRNKIWAEQTSTDRVSHYRFTYTQDMQARLLVNLGGYLSNSTMVRAEVKRVGDRDLEGSFSSVKRYWGGPEDVRIFFRISFNKPITTLNAWKGTEYSSNVSSISGDSLVVAPQYDVKKGEQLEMKVAISYTSVENARNNMQQECAGWDFDAVRAAARTTWNEWLSRIAVTGGSTAQKIKFYTDLWHVLLGRHKINDWSGDYPDRTQGERIGNFTRGDYKVRTVPKLADGRLKFNMYNSDAFWLTQWNLNILWGLAWPEVMDEMTASMLEYANNGYLLPRGPSGGGYSYIMTSCPTSNLVVSTYMKGLMTKADPSHAFEVVKRNHLPGGMLGSAEDIRFYTKNGWWPGNAGITIEAAFQDWGIAQMAKKLGRDKDARFFSKRADGWKSGFDPRSGLLFPKDKAGKFMHADPLSGAGWVEANAWQGTWGLSHGLDELARMMGGPDSFCNKLNYAFEKARSSDFVFSYTDGYVSYANQPGCSNAHVFSYAGKPWLSQYWVRRVQEQAYGGITPDMGYGGHDEDQGQMGAVSALMSIGLFNVLGNQSIQPFYEITSPVFDEVEIKLDNRYYSGKTFRIRTHGNGAGKDYIRSAKLNGASLDNFWFLHSDFAKGGELELWLDSTPNKSWGTANKPPVE